MNAEILGNSYPLSGDCMDIGNLGSDYDSCTYTITDGVDKCDFAIEIPQYGTKHSLNVSVSAGIVLWEFVRQLRELLES